MNLPNSLSGRQSERLPGHEKRSGIDEGIQDNDDATFTALMHSLDYNGLPSNLPCITDDVFASNKDDDNDNNTDNNNAHDNERVSVTEFDPFATAPPQLNHGTNNRTHNGTTEAPDRPPTMIDVVESTKAANKDSSVEPSWINNAIHNLKSTQLGFPESCVDGPTCIDSTQVISPCTKNGDPDTSGGDDTRVMNNSSPSSNSTIHSSGEESGQGEEDSGAPSTDDLVSLVSLLTGEWIIKDDTMDQQSAKSDVDSDQSSGNNTHRIDNGAHDPPPPLTDGECDGTEESDSDETGSTNTPPELLTAVDCRPAYVTDKNDSDVICGRATNETHSNLGNQRFRELVERFHSDYVATSKTAQKRRIADEVKARIASEGGRFLHKIVVLHDGTTKPYTRSTGQAVDHVQYIQATEDTIHEKVTKELRRKPDKRRFNGTGWYRNKRDRTAKKAKKATVSRSRQHAEEQSIKRTSSASLP